ncbi:hypothetical protein [Actinomadura terrae]|uniref:hypothetical protein n=1 Tax=Actinomadura terrae TaxID=604353 RepID=UPI001FA72400|nr:hypothetical protein [Actinomadura terrae]
MRVEEAQAQLLTCLDSLLYEYGTFSFGGPRRFSLSFCRQFDVDEDGAQARCELEYEPTPVLEGLGAHNQWWSGAEGEPSLQERSC